MESIDVTSKTELMSTGEDKSLENAAFEPSDTALSNEHFESASDEQFKISPFEKLKSDSVKQQKSPFRDLSTLSTDEKEHSDGEDSNKIKMSKSVELNIECSTVHSDKYEEAKDANKLVLPSVVHKYSDCDEKTETSVINTDIKTLISIQHSESSVSKLSTDSQDSNQSDLLTTENISVDSESKSEDKSQHFDRWLLSSDEKTETSVINTDTKTLISIQHTESTVSKLNTDSQDSNQSDLLTTENISVDSEDKSQNFDKWISSDEKTETSVINTDIKTLISIQNSESSVSKLSTDSQDSNQSDLLTAENMPVDSESKSEDKSKHFDKWLSSSDEKIDSTRISAALSSLASSVFNTPSKYSIIDEKSESTVTKDETEFQDANEKYVSFMEDKSFYEESDQTAEKSDVANVVVELPDLKEKSEVAKKEVFKFLSKEEKFSSDDSDELPESDNNIKEKSETTEKIDIIKPLIAEEKIAALSVESSNKQTKFTNLEKPSENVDKTEDLQSVKLDKQPESSCNNSKLFQDNQLNVNDKAHNSECVKTVCEIKFSEITDNENESQLSTDNICNLSSKSDPMNSSVESVDTKDSSLSLDKVLENIEKDLMHVEENESLSSLEGKDEDHLIEYPKKPEEEEPSDWEDQEELSDSSDEKMETDELVPRVHSENRDFVLILSEEEDGDNDVSDSIIIPKSLNSDSKDSNENFKKCSAMNDENNIEEKTPVISEDAVSQIQEETSSEGTKNKEKENELSLLDDETTKSKESEDLQQNISDLINSPSACEEKSDLDKCKKDFDVSVISLGTPTVKLTRIDDKTQNDLFNEVSKTKKTIDELKTSKKVNSADKKHKTNDKPKKVKKLVDKLGKEKKFRKKKKPNEITKQDKADVLPKKEKKLGEGTKNEKHNETTKKEKKVDSVKEKVNEKSDMSLSKAVPEKPKINLRRSSGKNEAKPQEKFDLNTVKSTNGLPEEVDNTRVKKRSLSFCDEVPLTESVEMEVKKVKLDGEFKSEDVKTEVKSENIHNGLAESHMDYPLNKMILTKAMLEDIVLEKVYQYAMDNQKNVIESLKQRCEELEKMEEKWKKKVLQLQKQITDILANQHKYFTKSPPPPKVQTRTVGVNVRIVQELELKPPSVRSATTEFSGNPLITSSRMVAPDPNMEKYKNAEKATPPIPMHLVANTATGQSGSSVVTLNKIPSRPPPNIIRSQSKPLSSVPVTSSSIVVLTSPNVATASSSISVIDLTKEDTDSLVTSKPTSSLLLSSTGSLQSGTLVASTGSMNRAVTIPNAGANLMSLPLVHTSLPSMVQLIPSGQTMSSAGHMRMTRPQTAVIPQAMNQPRVTYLLPPPTQSSLTVMPREASANQLTSAPTNFLPGTRQQMPAILLRMNSPTVTQQNAQPIPISIPAASHPISLPRSENSILPAKPSNTMVLSCVTNKHPAPLPATPVYKENRNLKLLPPKPAVKISKVARGIVLSWNMTLNTAYADIATYQLFAYQESNGPLSSALWKKVGDVKALPLPMACTLTQFVEGHKYHFAVRAVDVHNRLGPFSDPSSILLIHQPDGK